MLESLSPAEQEAASSQIASLYEQAGLPDRAIPYYLRAGEAASHVYAHEEALAAFQRAAALLTSLARAPGELSWQMTAAVYEQQGDILEMIGKHEEARQSYQQAKNAVPTQQLLLHARLARKIAVTLDYPPHLIDADRAYRESERLLEQVNSPEEQEWRDEWLQTHLGHLQIFFLLGEWQEMTRIIEQLQPFLEQHGSAAQRATFFMQIAMRDAVRDQYVVEAATVATCQRGLTASLETDNPHLIGSARFVLGYCLLLSDQFEQAEEELRAALAAGERVGDAELVARCRLHFLPLLWRRRGQVEAVRGMVTDAMAREERRYTSVINAQRAWVAWRDGRRDEAGTAGRAALEEWQIRRPAYPFQWTGLWPLIALAASSGQFALAVDYIRLLLAPAQQRPPEMLQKLLEEILQTGGTGPGERERVHSLLRSVLSLVRNMGYL
ncbi:MAG: hypothetical protein IMW89_08270 [Ktedonobacteraceae bacterium]|nr:hypothetical protein [Ktedonobacteraceae bacterium]